MKTRLFAAGLLAAALVLGTGLQGTADTKKKIANGAKQTGGTLEHGARSVGEGTAKVYHDTAHGIHKLIAKNTRNKEKRRSHLRRAAQNYKYAHRQGEKAEVEMDRAEKAASRVVD